MTGPIRGVNLGNWLVLERWMSASPLWTTGAQDDRGLVDAYPPSELDALLEGHRQTYITAQTFDWLACHGVNLVRIPVPYHLFGTAHHRPCVEYLDRAMDLAQQTGLGVLIDLHTVPQSQNGFDNGGYLDRCAWHKDPARIDFVLGVLEHVARRYAGHVALWGIEPLNEPASWPVFLSNMHRHRKGLSWLGTSAPMPRRLLKQFYLRCYHVLRPIVGSDVAIVLHDRFELGHWDRFMPADRYPNVWLDTHRYLCFCDGRLRQKTLGDYLALLGRQAHKLRRAAEHHPILVGEWCLGNHSPELAALDEEGRRIWYRTLADAQLATWDGVGGSCFWSLRVDGPGYENWSFEHCVEHGWIAL